MSKELQQLLKEEEEVNRQRLEHCNRCHTAIHGKSGHYATEKPAYIYDIPERCTVCRDDEWDEDPENMNALPNIKNGILCKCTYVGCDKEFYSRPSWYKRQQEILKTTGNPCMPILIYSVVSKVSRLLGQPIEPNETPDTEPAILANTSK